MGPESTLRLLQLNIFLRPPPINSLGGEYKDARMEHFVRDFLPQYDLVCLQECFGTVTDRRQRLIEKAKEVGFHGFDYSRRGCMVSCNGLKFTDGGLLILSKFPLSHSEFRHFKAACDVDKLAAKGVLYARVDLGRKDGKQVHLFTTHTQASYNFAANDASLEVKSKQLDEMAAFVKEMTDGHPVDWPVIVTGDFNMDSLQDKCPEYEMTIEHLKGCERELENGEMTKYVDVLLDHHGERLPTTVPFEWKTKNGLAIRSSLLSHDFQEYHRVNSMASDQQKAQAPDKITNAKSFVSTETNKTFWSEQCLDYIFAETGSGLTILSAHVDPLKCFDKEPDLPYTQISDHHGLTLEFTLHSPDQK